MAHISLHTLKQLGWNNHFTQQATTIGINLEQVARVLSAQRNQFLVTNGLSEWLCTPSGKLRHNRQLEYPVTGDWVIVDRSVIRRVIPRKNTLCRAEAGSKDKQTGTIKGEQPIAANLDTVFIVSGLDRDYNVRRIERFLTLVYNCGIQPVIVLTKADLQDDPAAFLHEIMNVAFDVPTVLTSSKERRGIDALSSYVDTGQTVCMLGSSGAGKSTLANLLCGSEIQATAAVSKSVGKGRHTTTSRELIAMPQGGLLMDNPGIREIAFSKSGEGLESSFSEIHELAQSCRFTDCSHRHEPGCAVLEAVNRGELSPQRLANYHKMQREMEYLQARNEKEPDSIEKERRRPISMEIKRMKKRRKH